MSKTGPILVVGFSEDQIEEMYNIIKSEASINLQSINKLTLCYRRIVFIDEKAVAIIHQSIEKNMNLDEMGCFNYGGWTVEGYPIKLSEYSEVRVSSTARSLGWIKTTFNNLSNPSTFVRSVSAEQTIESDM